MKKEDQPNQPVAAAPAPAPTPPPAPAPAPTPVAQPVVQPQAAVPQGPGFFSEYFKKVKSIFTNPKGVQEAAPSSIKDSAIFIAMNLGVMSIVIFFVSIIQNATSSNSDFGGDFFGNLFKAIFLRILFACIFISAITGIIYVISLIAKKESKFDDILSHMSIFSINFLAFAVVSIIGLTMGWVSITDYDLMMFITMICSLIMSLVFVYSCILIINGIVNTTKFNLFISTLIFVISSLLFVYILGRIFGETSTYLVLSFGDYGGISSSINALNAALEAFKNYNF